MGAIHSTQNLKQYTAKDVAQHVASMGKKYESYARKIEESGIDGTFVLAASRQTLHETLDSLQVTERLHRRKFERVVGKVSDLSQAEDWDTASLTDESSQFGSDGSMQSVVKVASTATPSKQASTGSISRKRRGHRKTPSDIPIDMVMECTLAAQGMDELIPGSSSNFVDGVMQAVIAAQAVEKENLKQDFLELEVGRQLESPPEEGTVTIVLTDVEHSTRLWEHNPKAMREALVLHDSVVRQTRERNHGYEIDTEGDAFFLAFSEPCDAVAFALDLQTSLYEAQWSNEILRTKWASYDGERRGLRVRVSIHMGQVETLENPVTGRTEYHGVGMDVAQEVEKMAKGGQILTTFDTWNAVFPVADVKLGSPRVSQLELPLVLTEAEMAGSSSSQFYKRIVELTPASMKKLTRAEEQAKEHTRRGSLGNLLKRHRSHGLIHAHTLTTRPKGQD